MNNQALQQKEQDIVIAMKVVKISKQRLQDTRDKGWDSLLAEISSICNKHRVILLNMDEKWIAHARSRRRAQEVTNVHTLVLDFSTLLVICNIKS